MTDYSSLPQKLDFEGPNNFREMGGYPVGDGKTMAQGRLFRSDHLGHMTEADQKLFAELGIKTVVDLRRENEREDILDNIQAPSVNQIWLPVVAEGADVTYLRRGMEKGTIDAEKAAQYLTRANQGFIDIHAHVFKEFLEILLDPASYPLVFHCSAGKDRAGFAAALALWIAGADDETVMHDYLATNHCTANYLNGLIDGIADNPLVQTSPEALRTLMQVRPEYLGAAIDAANQNYGSIQNFIAQALDITPEKRAKLQALLCE